MSDRYAGGKEQRAADAYADAELARALPSLDARLPAGAGVDVVHLDRRRLLAWLVGRSVEPSLPVLTPWTA